MKKVLLSIAAVSLFVVIAVVSSLAASNIGRNTSNATATPTGHWMKPLNEFANSSPIPMDVLTATLCSIATNYPGGYVMLYDIWGTPTPTPLRIAQNVTPTPSLTPTLPPGNALRGKQIFTGIGTCTACHRLTDQGVSVGPSLQSIGTRAGAKKPNISAEAYIRSVILAPDKSVTPLTKPGIMPPNFAQLLTAQQISDVVAFLLELK